MQFKMKLGVFRLDNLDPEEFQETSFERKNVFSGKVQASRIAKKNEMLKVYFSHPTWSKWHHEGVISSDKDRKIHTFSCIKTTKKSVKYKGVIYKGYVRLFWENKLFG